ncbi:MAG: hypothetical protein K0U93_20990, partial [Gammaproteobacteria bacterium]|nr:hypothetical protein [Gammaproteobacteria bacterium]
QLFSEPTFGYLQVDGLHFHLERLANGSTNLDDLRSESGDENASTGLIAIGGVKFRDAEFVVVDDVSNEHLTALIESLDVGAVVAEQDIPVAFIAKIRRSKPNTSATVKASASVKVNPDTWQIETTIATIELSDTTWPTGSLRFSGNAHCVSNLVADTTRCDAIHGEGEVNASTLSAPAHFALDGREIDITQRALRLIGVKAQLRNIASDQGNLTVTIEGDATLDREANEVQVHHTEFSGDISAKNPKLRSAFEGAGDVTIALDGSQIVTERLRLALTELHTPAGRGQLTVELEDSFAAPSSHSYAAESIRIKGQVSEAAGKAINAPFDGTLANVVVGEGVHTGPATIEVRQFSVGTGRGASTLAFNRVSSTDRRTIAFEGLRAQGTWQDHPKANTANWSVNARAPLRINEASINARNIVAHLGSLEFGGLRIEVNGRAAVASFQHKEQSVIVNGLSASGQIDAASPEPGQAGNATFEVATSLAANLNDQKVALSPLHISLTKFTDLPFGSDLWSGKAELKGDIDANLTNSTASAKALTARTVARTERLPDAIELSAKAKGTYDLGTKELAIDSFEATGLDTTISGTLSGRPNGPSQSVGQTEPAYAATLTLARTNLRRLLGQLQIPLPPMRDAATLTRVGGTATIAQTGSAIAISKLDVTVDESRIRGTMGIADITKVPQAMGTTVDLTVDRVRAHRYLPPGNDRPVTPIDLPLGFLETIHAKGRLRIGRFEMDDIEIDNLAVEFDGKDAPTQHANQPTTSVRPSE